VRRYRWNHWTLMRRSLPHLRFQPPLKRPQHRLLVHHRIYAHFATLLYPLLSGNRQLRDNEHFPSLPLSLPSTMTRMKRTIRSSVEYRPTFSYSPKRIHSQTLQRRLDKLDEEKVHRSQNLLSIIRSSTRVTSASSSRRYNY